MNRTLFFGALLASLPMSSARAANQWMVVHDLAPELAEDDKLTEAVTKLTRGRVLATGVALVTDEAVEEARTAMGMTNVSVEGLPTLIESVEAGHGLLVAVTAVDSQVVVAVYRYDVDTEVTTVTRKTAGKAALKRNLKKILTEILKPPKARKKKKKKRGEEEEEATPDAELRKVGFTITSLEAATAKELGLKRPAGVHITALAEGRVAARTLRVGDVILKLDKKKMKTPGELAGLLMQADLGDSFAFEVWRDGAKTKVELILGPEPVAEEAPAEEEVATETTEETPPPPPPEEPPPPPRKLGAKVRSISPEVATSLGLMGPTGALVRSVTPGGVAELAKLQANDVILTINDKPVTHARNLAGVVQDTYPRQRVRIEVWRDKKSVQLQAVFEDATTASAEKPAEKKPATP